MMKNIEKALEGLPQSVAEKISKGEIIPVSRPLYSVKDVLDKNVFNFFEANDTLSLGNTNLEGNKIPATEYFIIMGFRLLSVASTGAWSNSLPNELRNGELTFKYDNKEIIRNLPITAFRSEVTETIPTNTYELNGFLLEPSEPFSIEMRVPTAFSKKLRFELLGISIN